MTGDSAHTYAWYLRLFAFAVAIPVGLAAGMLIWFYLWYVAIMNGEPDFRGWL